MNELKRRSIENILLAVFDGTQVCFDERRVVPVLSR